MSELPRHEELWLLEHVTGKERHALVGAVELSEPEAAALSELRARRLGGEPLQYLIGTAPFGPIDVQVDARVLIPRPETEQLWERAMHLLPAGAGIVVDLCTGSGCLALATKHERPADRVIAADLSADAAAVAAANAQRLDLSVEVVVGDLFEPVDESVRGRVDLIVTNPPYVTTDEWHSLPLDVREHEPRMALEAGADGLSVVRRIAHEAAAWLQSEGKLVMEIGETQGRTVLDLFERTGWAARVERDHADRDRFVTAWRDQ